MRISDWSSDVCSSDLTTIDSADAKRSDRVFYEARPSKTLALKADKSIHARFSAGVPTVTNSGLELSVQVDPAFSTNKECAIGRSEEHTSELQSLMRSSYAVFCLKKQNTIFKHTEHS